MSAKNAEEPKEKTRKDLSEERRKQGKDKDKNGGCRSACPCDTAMSIERDKRRPVYEPSFPTFRGSIVSVLLTMFQAVMASAPWPAVTRQLQTVADLELCAGSPAAIAC